MKKGWRFKYRITPNYFLQFGSQFANFLVILMALFFLPFEDRTIWLLFFTISTLNPILLLGFESSIFRASSYILAGATEILPSGLASSNQNTLIDARMFREFASSTKYIFRFFSSVILVLMSIIGYIYFSSLTDSYSAVENMRLSWIIFSAGVFVNNLGIYKDSILRGSGAQNALNLVYICSRVGFFSITSLLLKFFASGLLVVSTCFLVSMIFQRLCILWVWNRSSVSDSSKCIVNLKTIRQMYHLLSPNSYRSALVFIGNFLTVRGGILLVPNLISVNMASDYVLGATLALGFSAIATELGRVKLPLLHRAQISKSISRVRKITKEIFLVSLSIYSFGSILLLFLAFSNLKFAFDFNLDLDLKILLILLIVYLFELIYSVSGIFLSSQNTIPMVKSSLITGIMNIVLSTVLGSRFGILGLVFTQFSLGLFFNYWYWLLQVKNRLEVKNH